MRGRYAGFAASSKDLAHAKRELESAMSGQSHPTNIRALDLSGITKVAMLGLGDASVLPLWFGESDLVTPEFIRDAATAALEDGKTFYIHARGIEALRNALSDYHRRTSGAAVEMERITVPGAAMLAITCALQALIETGDNIVIVSPIWPNIFQAAQDRRRGAENGAAEGGLGQRKMDARPGESVRRL